MTWGSVVRGVRAIGGVLGAVVAWGGMHKFATHAYGELCVPHDWMSALLSPVVVNATHCVALRYCIVHTASSMTVSAMALATASLVSLPQFCESKTLKEGPLVG